MKTRTRRYGSGKLAIRANFADAGSPLMYAQDGEDFRPSVFNVADARHDWNEAFRMIREWLEAGNG